VTVANYFDLRWLLLVPAVLAIGFMAWVFVSFARDRARNRGRDAFMNARRRNKANIWE